MNTLTTISLHANVLRHLLRNVYFITGTAYAGKSTMIRLLAEKYNGIRCGENYHDALMNTIDPVHQPNLSYFNTMKDWQEFISRTPEEYDAWITGCSSEAAELEIIRLLQLTAGEEGSPADKETGRKIFVDTNIPLEILREISDYHHVAVMLSPQSMSVERFFDRTDPEKQFLLRQIEAAPDPEKAMANFRACLAKINSPEHYAEYKESGFFTWIRTEESTIEETLAALEEHFRLTGGSAAAPGACTPRIFLISGPCGCGKSTLTKAFTQALAVHSPARQAYLVEGDLFHTGFFDGPSPASGSKPASADMQWDPLAPNAFAGKQMTWPDILAFNWDCIISTADRILKRGLDVVIDYVVEDELPLVKQLADKYQVPLYYIVLTASENILSQRIQMRGDTEMLDRSLFLKHKLEEEPDNQGHLLDNSGMSPEQEVKTILGEAERFLVR